MNKQELIEALADKEHASWARWMAYLFSKCQPLIGSGKVGRPDLIIPADLVERWQRQIETPYAALSEREKQSDRDEVAHILPFIDQYTEAQSGVEYVGKVQPPQMILPEWMEGDEDA